MRKSTEGSSMRKRGGRNPPTPLSDDPYLNWAVATGFQFARQGAGWVPLLIKLAPGHAVASFGAPEWRSGEPFKSGLLIPSGNAGSNGPARKQRSAPRWSVSTPSPPLFPIPLEGDGGACADKSAVVGKLRLDTDADIFAATASGV